MSAKLFVIELVHFTISCSNSTWATRPFLIWLNYSCLGCSVSRRKTRLSIIWPCHSFISYAILQLILTPSLYLLIYLTSLYFWWWQPPIIYIHVELRLQFQSFFKGSEVSRSEFSRSEVWSFEVWVFETTAITRSNIMTSKCKSEGNLFLTYKRAPDTDDLYDPSLIGVTYNEKNSEISL